MKHKYCTNCLTETKEYHYLKVLYIRENRLFVNSGIYQCATGCGAIVVEDIQYKVLRSKGHHIIKKLSGRLEE